MKLMMRSSFAALALLTGPALMLAPQAAPAALASPAASCPTVYWGSLPESLATIRSGPLTNVRSGKHACFDRIVFDVAGKSTGYQVKYVPAVKDPFSGRTVAVRGGAAVQFSVHAPAYNSRGQATYQPANRADVVNVTGYSALRQVRYVASGEGQTTFAIGVRGRLPLRVTVLPGPGNKSRVVLDIAHRW